MRPSKPPDLQTVFLKDKTKLQWKSLPIPHVIVEIYYSKTNNNKIKVWSYSLKMRSGAK